jgi:transcriptional regulator with XRE-family HTH domain
MLTLEPPAQKSLLSFVVAGLNRVKGEAGQSGGWRTVALETGVSFETIRKIASGRIANPGIKNLEKLAGYLRANKKVRSFAGNAKSLA